jgi:hypothetical protein
MRFEVKINESIVNHIEKSLVLTSSMTNRVSTAVIDVEGEQFTITPSFAIALTPALGGNTRVFNEDEIKIERGTAPFENCAIALSPAYQGNSTYLNHFFGGYVKIVEKITDALNRVYRCYCQDYNGRCASILVEKSYTGKTEAYMLNDLFSTYWTEIDAVTYVDGTTTVASIDFTKIYLDEAITKLAALFTKQWRIDHEKKLHYFTPNTTDAPFTLSDAPTSSQLIGHIINLDREDAARLMNRCRVIGNGVEVTRTDSASYAKYGRYFDGKLVDNQIDTTAWANLAGDAELVKYANENIRGRATLGQEGLIVGQKVYISNRQHALADYYLIQAVMLRMIGGLQEEVVIEFGDYSRDLVKLLVAISKLEQAT